MTNNQYGQVPDTLIDLIDTYAETRYRYGGIYNAKTEAARNAVIEALSGMQAQPVPAPLSDDVVKDAGRYRWLFGARTPSQVTSVQETVFKPLPQDEVLGHLQGFYMSKADVDAAVDAAIAAQGGKA